ncbi:Piriformospora indica-insensitive protein 2 [Linum perenne]
MNSMQGLCRKNMCSLLLLLLLLLGILLVGKFDPCRGSESEEGSAPMLKEEKEALFAAIQGFVGKWWNGSDLYPDPCGWTPIQGVSCDVFDGYWYTTSLQIGPVMENSLQCSSHPRFTRYLFQLTHLHTLSFFNCFVDSHVRMPASVNTWEMLSNSLETLEFRSNQGLIGSIPSSLGKLKKLKSLILLENGLQGGIPNEIGNLMKLKQLVLSSNRLCAQIPETLGTLPDLLILDASRNSLTGSIPRSFGALTSLLKLDLSNNQIESNLPEEIANLTNLTLLDLRNNKLSGGLVPQLESIVSLKELILSGNTIGGELTGIQWRSLQNLEVLDLSDTGLIGTVPETVAELKKLRFLGLSDNFLSGSVSPKLAEMEDLGALYLQNNNFSGVLGFQWRFYGRMGRRFGAWGNRNLCYLEELMTSSPEEAMAGRNSVINGSRRPPYGVKRCRL